MKRAAESPSRIIPPGLTKDEIRDFIMDSAPIKVRVVWADEHCQATIYYDKIDIQRNRRATDKVSMLSFVGEEFDCTIECTRFSGREIFHTRLYKDGEMIILNGDVLKDPHGIKLRRVKNERETGNH